MTLNKCQDPAQVSQLKRGGGWGRTSAEIQPIIPLSTNHTSGEEQHPLKRRGAFPTPHKDATGVSDGHMSLLSIKENKHWGRRTGTSLELVWTIDSKFSQVKGLALNFVTCGKQIWPHVSAILKGGIRQSFQRSQIFLSTLRNESPSWLDSGSENLAPIFLLN